jgi:S1-C subfamily serine protease
MRSRLSRRSAWVWFALLALVMAHARPVAAQERKPPPGFEPIRQPTLYERLAPSVVTVIVLGRDGKQLRTGSGVVTNAAGDVVTNFHVVAGGTFFEIRGNWSANQGDTLPARPFGCAKEQDLAVLRFAAPPAVAAARTTKELPSIGTKVFALGAPFGLDASLSEGIVSQIRREPGRILIQTTAAISPGSSGGGLFLANGALVGITSMRVKGGEGVNFAVSIGALSDSVASCTSFVGDTSVVLPRHVDFKIEASFFDGKRFTGMDEFERAAYAAGLFDGMQLSPTMGAVPGNVAKFDDCVGLRSAEQVAEILLRYLKQHPERMGHPMNATAYSALREMCPQ